MATAERGASSPVLVTGCSTGIGRATVKLLSAKGRPVYAGARKDQDLAALGELPHVTPLRLDVTDLADVQGVVHRVEREGKGLHGLVNNAGVVGYGPLVETSVEELERVYEVNLYGVHRMTQALLPFLIESKGRIVNLSSIAGVLTPKFMASYNISKHALEAYSDNLREELAQFGVSVSAIEPGTFESLITASSFPFLLSPEQVARSRFREELVAYYQMLEVPDEKFGTKYPPPTRVAEAIFDALFSETPKPRYLVGSREETKDVVRKVLSTLSQVNQNHEHSLSREELLEIFDEVRC